MSNFWKDCSIIPSWLSDIIYTDLFGQTAVLYVAADTMAKVSLSGFAPQSGSSRATVLQEQLVWVMQVVFSLK